MTTNKNPASGCTLGGAGNDDLAARGSNSKVKRDTAPKQPGAPLPCIVGLRRGGICDLDWIVELDCGARIILEPVELLNYRRFCAAAFSKLGICFAPMKPREWADLLHEALNGGES